MDCVCCGRSLAGGVLRPPWEDGDNEYAYVTCPYCGEENIQDSNMLGDNGNFFRIQ